MRKSSVTDMLLLLAESVVEVSYTSSTMPMSMETLTSSFSPGLALDASPSSELSVSFGSFAVSFEADADGSGLSPDRNYKRKCDDEI